MKTDPNAPFHPLGQGGPCPSHGLTKREWFTGMALEGLLSDHAQMAAFEGSARKAAVILVAEKKKNGEPEVDVEEQTREAFDTLIAFRAVEIADMVIHRLNFGDPDEAPPEPSRERPAPLPVSSPGRLSI